MRPRGKFVALCVCALAVLAAIGRVAQPERAPVAGPTGGAGGEIDRVERVVDGDTVYLERLGKVRIIGVDTPERNEPGFDEATRFTERFCLGRTVHVEVCPVRSHDRYGRLRALVYVEREDGGLRGLSEALIRAGHSDPCPMQPCHIEDDYWYGIRADGGSDGER
jgi:endonuclease YncB( thermonuclease family)